MRPAATSRVPTSCAEVQERVQTNAASAYGSVTSPSWLSSGRSASRSCHSAHAVRRPTRELHSPTESNQQLACGDSVALRVFGLSAAEPSTVARAGAEENTMLVVKYVLMAVGVGLFGAAVSMIAIDSVTAMRAAQPIVVRWRAAAR